MKRLNIDWDEQPLGDVPDQDLADKIGCSRVTVREQRTKRGIKAKGRSGIDWDAQPLGQTYDSTIAQSLGCHESSVRKARSDRGIAPFCRPEVVAEPDGYETPAHRLEVSDLGGLGVLS